MRNDQRPAGQAAVIMVTSALPAEGKTTVSLALARSYAMLGKRTLLIDADLRRPGVHRALGMEPSEGLLEFLADSDPRISISDIFRADPLTDLSVLLGARCSEVPTDQLISQEAFQRLVSAASRTFDIVILDTPPLAPVVDGLYIAQYVNAAVFVVQWAQTSQADVRKALGGLQEAMAYNASIALVLNQQDVSRSYSHARHGDYYVEQA